MREAQRIRDRNKAAGPGSMRPESALGWTQKFRLFSHWKGKCAAPHSILRNGELCLELIHGYA
jgi:hypothetical protein